MLRMVDFKKDDTRNWLSYIQLFEGLTPTQLDWVAQRAHRRIFEAGRNVMGETYDFTQATPGGVFEVGPFRVTPYEMTHIGVPSLGFKIEADGKVLAYTGDTGPCDEAVKLAQDSDLFLCEATYQNDSELSFFHLSALQAAEHAAAGGAARLVLTHITPNLDPGVSLEQAAVGYEGSIDVAVPDMVIEVGA